MRRAALIGAAAVLALVVIGLALEPVLTEFVKRRLVSGVEEHFDGTVDVTAFRIGVFPAIRVTGSGLRLRRHGSTTAEPLITVDEFSVTTNLWRLAHRGIRRVEITGLRIHVPSEGDAPPPGQGTSSGSDASGVPEGLSIDEIVSTDARLEIAPDEPDGTPLVFDIRSVRLEHFSLEEPAAYQADLTNPKPRGEIASTGRFGPWNPEHPRLTPVAGDYTLAHADMSVFNGLGGTLESIGRFEGRLESIDVTGTTSMSDFRVDTGQHPMPLQTTFQARVDGTNGNTYLDRVSARLAESDIQATGEIAGTPDSDGKWVRLDVSSDEARLEDFIYLVLSEPMAPMSGLLEMQARLELPPGDTPVPDKLFLDGRFTVRAGRFASEHVQDKVDELSRRGQGEPKNMSIDDVLSDFGGRFTLQEGQLQLPNVRFRVHGAEIRLAGSYALRGEVLDFEGELRLKASLSETTTGFKSFLLKIIDPLFRRNGAGAVLPIKVEGTVSKPEFGVDLFGRLVRR